MSGRSGLPGCFVDQPKTIQGQAQVLGNLRLRGAPIQPAEQQQLRLTDFTDEVMEVHREPAAGKRHLS